MQPSEAVNKAFDQHKPQGDDVSRSAAMVMLDCAMNELNRADCHKAVPMKTADAVAKNLQEKLAEYGVTKLTLFDSNNDGKFDKNDEVIVGKNEVVKGTFFNSTKPVDKVETYKPQQHDHTKEFNFNQNQKDAVQKLGDGSFGEWFKNQTTKFANGSEQEKFVKDVVTALKDTGHKTDYSYSRATGLVDLKVDGKPYTTHIGY